jgi:hypothetical protein
VKCAYVTLAGTEDERHPVGQQSSGHEQQRLSRGRVQPLSVIHYGDDRAFLRSLTQQAQRRDEGSKPVRDAALLLAERAAQCPRLRRGQPVQVRQHGTQQPVQCREHQRRLRLNALRPQHPRARRARRRIGQQRRLTDPRLAAHNHDPTAAGRRIGEHGVKPGALRGAPPKHAADVTFRA